MPDLLLELLSEEIPARFQARAARDLEKAVNQRLLDAGFMPEGVKAFAGPRRLTVVATGLPAAQADRKEEKKGPRVGAPEKAVEGFLKSAGLSSLDQCETRDDKKGQFYVAVIDQKGRATPDLIAEFVPEIITGFKWEKSMRWGDGDLRWVRPLKSILCTFNDEIVSFEVAGIKSGDETSGHRFMDFRDIQARNFEKYETALARAHVVLDGDARMETIARDAKTLCEAQGFELVEDKGLLAEVAGLAEWPVAMMGAFDEKFLTLPDEVLTASMRGHQKYFSVRDPKTGRLANRFVYVANIESSDGGKAMRAGYERVLTARLSDAWYLYHQDLKRPLAERIVDLDRITFFEGLGSVGDKARRVAALAREIAPSFGADPDVAERAAMLAKADLVTGMVYEFPELQGVMGRYYHLAQSGLSSPVYGGGGAEGDGGGARAAKNPLSHAARDSSPAGGGAEEQVADAIRDHYKPQGQDDAVPTDPVTVAVALADKIDTLTAFWAIDKKPTGSSDPFALRRAALGVISLMFCSTIRLNIRMFPRWMLDACQANQPECLLIADDEDLLSFFHDRLKVYLRDKSHKHDHIDAVLTSADGQPEDDLVLIVAKLNALEVFLKSDDGANLVAGFKRAANILKAEAKKGDLPSGGDVREDLLSEAPEKMLFDVLAAAEKKAGEAVAAEDFAGAMSALASLRAPIDAFFEKVTVNADDAGLRANRLALLQRFITATGQVADLSKLEG